MTPDERAASWGTRLLEPVPVPGLAHAVHWRETEPGSIRARGKNHPLAGAWLVSRYCPPGGNCADPMIGVGGLWLNVPPSAVGAIYGAECEQLGVLAERN